MLASKPSLPTRYAFVILIVALATLLRFALEPILDLQVPFILYFPAVVLCAWFGGLWPGLVSCALSGLIAWYVFIPPQYSFRVFDKTAPTQLIVFLFAGALISLLAEDLHRARRQTEQSEAKEREQREQLRVTLASIGDAVIATDAQARITFVNHIAESLILWEQAEAVGRPLREIFNIVNEQTRQPVENPAIRAIKEGVIFGLANHTVLIARDGTELPIDDSGAPIKDAEGKILGSVLIFRDITERRKTEKERALLAGIVESSEDAIISKSLDGVIESWNASAERLFGYSVNEAIGQPITIIVPPDRIHEEQLILERLRKGERLDHFETVRQSKDGRRLDISLTVSPVRDASGRIIGASKIVRDISERKRTEEALHQQREWLRVTLASIGDAVITTDTNGLVTFLNPVGESLTGWKLEEAQHQPLETVFQIVNEQTRQPVGNPALRAIKEGVVVGLANHTILIGKGGSEMPIDDSGAPIKDADGSILGAVLIFRDISERRLAEETFRLAVEASPAAKVMTDEAGLITLVNIQAERLFGYNRAELIGQPVEMLVPDRYRGKHSEYRAGFTREPQARAMGAGRDLFGLRKDGSEVPIEIGLNPIEVKGRTLVLSSILDITERNRAEQELRESKSRLAAFLEQLPVGAGLIDADGRVIVSNAIFRRFVSEVIPSRDPKDGWRWQCWDADGQLLDQTQWPSARALRGETVSPGLDMKYTADDGKEIWTRVGSTPFRNETGEIIGAISVIEEIDEQKRAEQEIRNLSADLRRQLDEMNTLLDILPVGVWIGNKDCSKITGNQAGYEIFGLPPGINASVTCTPSEMPVGIRTLVNDEEVHPEDLPMQRVARTGEEWRNFEHALVFPNGTTKTIYGSVAPLFDDKNEVRGVLAAYMDFTERKRADEERFKLLARERAAREQAEAANHAKDEFVAMVSHEIRSPLSAILGWTQLLRKGKLDKTAADHAIETIEHNAKSQAQLIEDLMDISRVITGKLTLNVRPVEPAQVIEAAIDTIRPAAEAKSIQLQVAFEPKATLISGDPSRLQQIVWNLLSNAVKFTPNQGRIKVKAEQVDSNLQIEVSDTGAGINPEFLPFVFDRFSQGSTGSERKYRGLGLGLAIVRHLVELHGGTVRADSPGQGQGSTFTVILPVKVIDAEMIEFGRIDPIADLVGSPVETVKLNGVRVVVVDDESEIREVLTAILTGSGAVVKACASAAEALEVIEQWRPAVLVSDVGMPNEDGYSFVKKLRALGLERGGNTPAVALTAYAKSEDRLRALAAGFQMHVPKPVESDELILVIASLVGRSDKSVMK